jgi:hypothetical protein
VSFRLGAGDGAVVVPAIPDEDHDEQLTRDDVTASVHYIRFELSPDEIERFAAGPVALVVDHPQYREETALTDESRAELLTDLRG